MQEVNSLYREVPEADLDLQMGCSAYSEVLEASSMQEENSVYLEINEEV